MAGSERTVNGERAAKVMFAARVSMPDSERTLERLRQYYGHLKQVVEGSADESRERSLAITKLEESAMWAFKAVVQGDPLEGE